MLVVFSGSPHGSRRIWSASRWCLAYASSVGSVRLARGVFRHWADIDKDFR
jgi:hypothetical protein